MYDTSPGEVTLSLPDAPSTVTSIRARLGDARSQAALGRLHTQEGRYLEALEWLEEACAKLPVAAVLYYNAVIFGGTQTSSFLGRAVSHLRSAAGADCWEAQQVLASLYIHGEGVAKDLDAASRLIESSTAIRNSLGA